MDAQALYMQLGQLTAAMPDFRAGGAATPAMLQWVGKVHALLGQMPNGHLHTSALGSYTLYLPMGDDLLKATAATGIAMVLYRALAEAELAAPTAAQGAFIPAGSSFDAIAALSKVLETATADVLIIDPYMDDKTLSDFVPLVREHISVRLLADQQAHKPSLKPAVVRWQQQYQQTRPLVTKLAMARTLHDRVILIDGDAAWSLSQSLNAFAIRSPATIVRVDADTAALKIVAYEAMWASATAI